MTPDLLVVGAGAFGLSVAWSARRAGLSVRVLDAVRVGAGASGGPVGALAPHAPSKAGDLHDFQFAALASLPARVAEVEAASGLSAGYARCGRLVPLRSAGARARAEADAAAAPARWAGLARYDVLDALPAGGAGWITPEAVPHGVVHETLSARIEPRGYLAALAGCLGNAVTEGVTVGGIDPEGPAVLTGSGRIATGAVVLAAGWRTWDLATPLAPGLAGMAVKGQAAPLALDAPDRPLVTDGGLYIVPHACGVAVGATSEAAFIRAETTDAALDDVIARARALCPPLSGAPVMRRWAGLRPKPPGRVPVAGPLPGYPNIHIAGGGFRIGIGVAHAIGDAVVAGIADNALAVPVPASFRPGAD